VDAATSGAPCGAPEEIVSWHAVHEVAGWLERADPPQSENATPNLAVVQATAWHLPPRDQRTVVSQTDVAIPPGEA
jgi:hypothetical protein